MTKLDVFLAVAQAVAILLVGYSLSSRFLARMEEDIELGGPERLLFSIVGGVAFAIALMIGNVLAGGRVFRMPVVVPVVAAIVLATGWRHLRIPRRIEWAPLIVFVVLLFILFAGPSLAGRSSIRSGDSPWHLGWSEQLLGGEAIPTGPAPGYGRNAYPWGWHALVATLVRLVPGTSTTFVAYEALQLLLLIGLPCAGACLARRLDPAAGWPGAVAMSLVGGFGWVIAWGPAFVATPDNARFGADLVVASPNSVYELFAPPLPRELGVVLLAAAATLLVYAARDGGRMAAAAAGICAGLLGVVSVPLFVGALVWFVVAFIFRFGRELPLVWFLFPALLIFGLWAAPVIANYAAYGGFVDITPHLGREWDILAALTSWGLLLPLALIGVFIATRNPDARPLLACGLGTALLLAASFARGAFDWTLGGNATLLHQGRVWPIAHLLGAAFAGLAVVQIARAVRRFGAPIAGALAPVLIAVCVASPALASAQLTKLMVAEEEGFAYGGRDYNESSFARRAANKLTPHDVVQVQGSDHLAFVLFQLSGVRLANYDDPRLKNNDLRIRYQDLAARWDAEMGAGGFEANYLVLPDPDPSRYDPIVVGTFQGQVWSLVRAGRE